MNLFKDLQTLKLRVIAYLEALKKEYTDGKEIMFFSITDYKTAKIDFVEYTFGSVIESEYVVTALNELPFKSFADKRNIPKASEFGTYLWNLTSPSSFAAVDNELNFYNEAVPLYLTKEALKMNMFKLPEAALSQLTCEQISVLNSHYPFMEGGLLCFYKNAKDFFAYKVTKMKPGRALKFMLPDVDNEVIKRFVGKLQIIDNLRIEVSKNFADIYTGLLYTDSCMADGESKFSQCYFDGEFIHPVSCYNHPDSDISIAAIYEGERLIGRTLVNCKSQHSRVFFDKTVPNSHWRVTNFLEKKWYYYSNDTLRGRKLLKVELDCGGILCPYVEPGNAGVELHDDHLTMFGKYECNHELGMLKGFTGSAFVAICDDCISYIDEEDYDYSFVTDDGETICQHCLRQHYTPCYSFEQGAWTYVRDNSSSLYMVKAAGYNAEVSPGDYITDIGHSDYVCLDDDYYGRQKCAHIDACSFDDCGYAILTEDLDRFNLFFCEESCSIKRKEDYAWFDFELMCISDVDMSEYDLIPDAYENDMPMYRSKP